MLSRKYGERIKDNKVDEVFRNVNEAKTNNLIKSPFSSKQVFTIILLRKGLRMWKNRAKNSDVVTIFNNQFFMSNENTTPEAGYIDKTIKIKHDKQSRGNKNMLIIKKSTK